MKKLMILAVAAIAMAMGGQAEAAFRLTIDDGTTTQVFYERAPLNTGSIDFSFAGVVGRQSVLSTNNPGGFSGLFGYATLSQSLALTTTGAVTNKTITAVVDVIDTIFNNDALHNVNLNDGLHAAQLAAVNAASAIKNFTLPGAGFAESRTLVSHNTSDAFLSSGSMTGYTMIDGTTQTMSADNDVLLVGGTNSGWVPVVPAISAAFQLTNKLTVTFSTYGATSDDQFVDSKSEVRGSNIPTNDVVPEPTSMALAGFAGVGMAIGAIRRRRQAKLAA